MGQGYRETGTKNRAEEECEEEWADFNTIQLLDSPLSEEDFVEGLEFIPIVISSVAIIQGQYINPADYAESKKAPKLKSVLNKDSIQYLQHLARQVPIANDLKKYIVDIVTKTRKKKDLIEYGASPRASIGLTLASEARALIEGRKFVSKTDIHAMVYPVLRHRIILSFEAERQGMDEDAVIKTLLK